jgi:hypothetical protein
MIKNWKLFFLFLSSSLTGEGLLFDSSSSWRAYFFQHYNMTAYDGKKKIYRISADMLVECLSIKFLPLNYTF